MLKCQRDTRLYPRLLKVFRNIPFAASVFMLLRSATCLSNSPEEILRSKMSRHNLATIQVLTWREIKRFFRQRSRLAGALMQPILFWLILGSGFAHSFRTTSENNMNYLEYFFPGVVAMMALFTAI